MIGLGRMGGNMTRRLVAAGHRMVVYNHSPGPLAAAAAAGAEPKASVEEVAAALSPPRAVWVMVPAGDPTASVVEALAAALSPGDLVVDGGNSNYRVSTARAATLAGRGIQFLDVGTSGGVWGLTEGYSMMVGGPPDAVGRLRPIFEALAPAPDRGWGHVGPSGAGHFAKMVHNGIEYGLMQAYAEGFSILAHKTELGLDVHGVAEIWRHGSVVRSWLLDLTARALEANPTLEGIAPVVADSGEGRWTVAEAIELDVPAPVITMALIQRLRSRDAFSYADRLLALMRQQFGGHAVLPEDVP